MITYTYEPKHTLSEALMQLFAIAKMLRSPDGCPWDKQQTTKTIASNMHDEVYEYQDALYKNDVKETSEELGDVLFNVFLLMEMHQEKLDFDIVQSVNAISEKLYRRHPHVFGDTVVQNTNEVLDNWEKIKKDVEGKKPDKDDFFSRVPDSLPPLERCKEISKQAVKVGFDWPDKQGIIDKVCEELDEVIEADTALDRVQDEVEMEIGDLLFAVANLARFMHVDPATALHRSNEKFERRFNEVVKLAAQEKTPLDKAHVAEENILWDRVKQAEKGTPGHKKPSTY